MNENEISQLIVKSAIEVQTLTYLRRTGFKRGLVINFGERLVKDGVHRVVTGL